MKFPSELEYEATSVDGANDWTIVQPSGAKRLYKIRPLAAVPDLPASKTTSGTFNASRIPSLPASQITSGTFDMARIPPLGEVLFDEATTATAGLTVSYTAQKSGVISPSGTEKILILARFSGYTSRRSTAATGIQVRVTEDGVVIEGGSYDIYACYQQGNAGQVTVGGTTYVVTPDGNFGGDICLPIIRTISTAKTYAITAKKLTSGDDAYRNYARLTAFRIRS